MKKLLLSITVAALVSLTMFAQSTTFLTSTNNETTQKNAIMPAQNGVYVAMQKTTTSSSLYWYQNNILSEVKSIGNQLASVYNSNGSYGKQWFTNGNNALFVSQNGLTGTRSSAIWYTDGTSAGTDTVLTFAYGTNVNIAGMIGTDLYFTVISLTPYQTLLYKTNFTKAGTSLVKTIGKTNLNWNYVDNGVLYLNGYVKIATYSYSVLYSYTSDTTRLLLGSNFFPAKVINGNLYAYANGSSITKKNLTSNVVTNFYFPDTKEGDKVSHIDEIVGVFKDKLYLKCNLSLSSNNIANYRLYTGNITETGSTINFTELRSANDKAIIIPNKSLLYTFGENVAFFIGVNDYAGNINIFATDGTNAKTHAIQELMTGTAWAFTYEARAWSCGDRFYFYGTDYKTGSTVNVGRTLSTCDSTSGSLTPISLNAGSNAIILDMVNYQGNLLFSIDSFSSNSLYAIDACSSYTTPISNIDEVSAKTVTFDLYPNPSKGIVTIKVSEEISNATIIVSNVLGEKLYNTNIGGQTSAITLLLKAGIYFVSLNNNGNIITK